MSELEKYIIAFLIGFRIRTLRKIKKIPQAELGKGLVGQSMFSLIENGRILPQSDVLQTIARRLSDPILEQYADLILRTDVHIDDFFHIDPKEMKRALETFNGKWTYVHSQLVTNLYKYLYANRLYTEVCETFNLTMKHHPEMDRDTYATACFYYGSTLSAQGNLNQALHWLQTAESNAERLDKQTLGRLYFNLAYGYQNTDASGLALTYARLAVEVLNETATLNLYGRALLLLGTTQGRCGLFTLAKNTLLQAQAIIEHWETAPSDRIRLLVNFADVHESLREYSLAQTFVDKILLKETNADPVTLSSAHRIQCRIHVASRKGDEAKMALQRAMAVSTAAKDFVSQAWSCILAIEIYDDVTDKMHFAEQAYACAKQTGNLLQQALAGHALTKLYFSSGQIELAHALTNLSLQHYRTLIDRNFSINLNI